MQKVAAYLLEWRGLSDQGRAREKKVAAIENVLRQWLTSKSVTDSSTHSGTFKTREGLEASYHWEFSVDNDRSWRLLRLGEPAAEGGKFITAVSVTNTGSQISVYVSLEAGSNVSTIKPIPFTARCPGFVHQLLKMDVEWFHGATPISPLQDITGIGEGFVLGEKIEDPKRSIPIIAISKRDGELILPELAQSIAYDLEGLANVVVLDDEASYGLTWRLGKRFSCYSGAIRIYWPRPAATDSPFNHPLWTASRLQPVEERYEDFIRNFRRQLRFIVMQASALSVLRPREIDDIRSRVNLHALQELRNKAATADDYMKLAESYARDNDELRVELEQVREQLTEASTRLLNAELINRSFVSPNIPIVPAAPSDGVDSDEPKSGEVRFYKKISTREKFDRLELVQDCGHNRWQSGHKGDKAKKGIEHFEGSSDWRNVWHCGVCTGGGLWKVQW